MYKNLLKQTININFGQNWKLYSIGFSTNIVPWEIAGLQHVKVVWAFTIMLPQTYNFKQSKVSITFRANPEISFSLNKRVEANERNGGTSSFASNVFKSMEDKS